MLDIIYSGKVKITIGDKIYYYHNNGTVDFFNNLVSALATNEQLEKPRYVQFTNNDNLSSSKSEITATVNTRTANKIYSLHVIAQVTFNSTVPESETFTLKLSSDKITLAEVTNITLGTINPTQQILVDWELQFSNNASN